ncbi:esterase [Polaribacter reichenbachii]|uniref:Esterase n=1 Tax=Polaribacter reichenbachii TaxID=996801 RepID=A0A1B8TV91_9FLAO|nr:alpha/beta hydrolase [Polaribacter reichenbachii]APZ45410.1 esterase [Polaribacter reichenbachii]AUC19271.1 esterase [Polaribacter reichenbachii]OBY63573.1 esterase [Polaribacter reichenbachii]
MKHIAVFIFFLFTTNFFAFQKQNIDTSYTINSAFNKYKKSFPKIKIVPLSRFKNVSEINNIIYKSLKSRNLKLDAFINKRKNNPAVVLVHGGGWKSGNKSHMHALAQNIASKGYSCFAIEYRLADEAKYPKGIFDVKSAIKFIKLNAKRFHTDSSKVVILGASSGAQMATLVGTTNNNIKFEEEVNNIVSATVKAIINLDGILAFKHPESKEGKMASLWLGGSFRDKPKIWKEASPLFHTDKNTPPILFINSQFKRFHAGRDDMIKILDNYAIYSQIETIPNSPHTFWLFQPYFNDTLKIITQFLKQIFKSN